MKTSPGWTTAAALLAAVAMTGCSAATSEAGSRTVQPGVPGEATRVLTADEVAAGARTLPYTEADVRFMQGMIAHHVQALDMSALVPERTTRQDIRTLARRIVVSQHDEIALMQQWLRARGEDVPDASNQHLHDAAHGHPGLMPGMLTGEQMARLEAATGAEFDYLFLTAMIHHHQGALIMVQELFSSPGAAQDMEVFQFASHVDSDQRAEIARMRRMLPGI